ncbi:MAG: hypothetical protein E5W06_04085 [Mesorhizobium sp.]|nr:MAG: hypothetical protein E5W06_04085 [Mesorhizobium sp.]
MHFRLPAQGWNLRQDQQFLSMANHPITSFLTSIGTFASRPAAFQVLLAYAALCVVFDRQSLNWYGAATLAPPAGA